MSDPSIQDVVARLDDLLKEVRRQGRAAIAAQAAAESCLEAVRASAEPPEPADPEGDAEDDHGAEAAVRWARALIPVADAVDRIVQRAEAPRPPRPLPKASLLQRLSGFVGGPPDLEEASARAALAEGLRVLHAQLDGVLQDMGVTVDRRTGGPVDGERQRVIEVRPPRAGEAPGVVVEVIRPGYALGAKVLREAEVAVTGGGAR
jgi:molecular chaperone GrpE